MEHARTLESSLDDDRSKWLLIGAIAVAMGLVLRSAWVAEDAYITLRTVDNWVNGYGLRWNTDDRVQGYTHPLWMMLLSALYLVARDEYAITILAGLGTSLAALLVLARNARSAGHALAAIALLALSRSFVDFSTSGLENPLTHLLVAVFVGLYLVRSANLRACALVAALLALNRIDAVLVVTPALVHLGVRSLRARGFKQTAIDSVVGFSPLFAWEAFSLFYYGFLVPNTAFSKLNTGIASAELARQGITYILNAAAWDLPLIMATAVGLVLGAWQKSLRHGLLALGALLYYGYVVRIGGDFMLGRFLTLPLFVAVCLIADSQLPLERPERVAVLLVPFLLTFFHPAATDDYPVGDWAHSGVADERSLFREHAGLMMFTRHRSLPQHPWATLWAEVRARKERVFGQPNIGYMGFEAGPHVHIVDSIALTEPLLARLPMRYNPAWRVGHYYREIPAGYMDTLRSGTCQMPDKSLCEYFEKLRLIIAGDLWSWERLKTIVAMNFGAYDHLLDVDRYRHPDTARADLQDVSTPLPDGTAWDDPRARTFGADGIVIRLPNVSHASLLKLSLDANDSYSIEFRKGTEALASTTVGEIALPMLRTRVTRVPPAATRAGFDHILVRPLHGDKKYSVAHLRLGP